jgi:hypothetical protein
MSHSDELVATKTCIAQRLREFGRPVGPLLSRDAARIIELALRT